MIVLLLCLATCPLPLSPTYAGSGALANTPPRRLWKPVADEVYLQEISQKIPTDKPVTSIAAHQDVVYVVVGETMKTLGDGTLKDATGAPSGVKRMRLRAGALWASGENGTYRFTEDKWSRMGRYYGFIEPPAAQGSELTSIQPRVPP